MFPSHALALCAIGLERVCSDELVRLGFPSPEREPGRVRFALGDDPSLALFRANLRLRTADRILVEAAVFPAEDFDRLFETVRSLEWELYCGPDGRPVVDKVRTRNCRLASVTAVQSIVHKAVYDRLGRKYGFVRLPETGERTSVRVYLENDVCVIGVDTSGDPLHRRGYRRMPGRAPLRETVAAGVLFFSGWSRRLALLDPACGSGTIAIEAALHAIGKVPGLDRPFRLETMPFAFRLPAIRDERTRARTEIRNDVEVSIDASDIDPQAIAAARANASLAGVGHLVRLSTADAAASGPHEARGTILCNPPYGQRIGSADDAGRFIGTLGALASRRSRWGAGILTDRDTLPGVFGRKSSKVRKITDGAEERWFHWYPPSSEEDSAAEGFPRPGRK